MWYSTYVLQKMFSRAVFELDSRFRKQELFLFIWNVFNAFITSIAYLISSTWKIKSIFLILLLINVKSFFLFKIGLMSYIVW